jgi:hypothetical protein
MGYIRAGSRRTCRCQYACFTFRDVSHTRCVPPSPQPASPERRLIIISGEEGAGKSTIVRALLPSTPYGARIDAGSQSLTTGTSNAPAS